MEHIPQSLDALKGEARARFQESFLNFRDSGKQDWDVGTLLDSIIDRTVEWKTAPNQLFREKFTMDGKGRTLKNNVSVSSLEAFIMADRQRSEQKGLDEGASWINTLAELLLRSGQSEKEIVLQEMWDVAKRLRGEPLKSQS